MVERELFQVSSTFPQQSLHSPEAGRPNAHANNIDQESTNAIALQQEAESLSGTFSNVDFDEMTDTTFLPESENHNVFSDKELYLMNQSTPEEFSFSSGNDLYNMPEQFSNLYDQYLEQGSPVSLWGCPMDLDVLKMDEVFQVDKADLVQSPTLAELNANDESLFDSFDSYDLGFFSENNVIADTKSSKPQAASLVRLDLQNTQSDLKTSHTKLNQIKVIVSDENPVKPNILQTAQLICDNVKIVSSCANPVKVQVKSSPNDHKLQTVPSIPLNVNQKKSSLPTTANPVKMELQSRKSDVKDCNQLKKETTSVVDKETKEEVYDSDEDDSDMDFYNSSDTESIDEDMKSYVSSSSILEKKRSRYFWQYNIQSKGPKGPKMKQAGNSSNFQNNLNARDPVLSSNQFDTLKYASKSRRGDGNDLTPNPRKLFSIGIELQKLNSIIDNLKPVNELPFNARCKSRKEKNKLASRACRLKKKAQHEANKLKLFGLQQEQRFIINSICSAKKVIKQALENNNKMDKQMLEQIKGLASKNAFTKVAGHSADYVNAILERVASGDSSGGLRMMTSLAV